MSTQVTPQETRRYRKRLRAEQELRTRQAITEAAMKLHGTLGPAHTTVSAVAEEAGVQRATVYRHFPDEASLFQACSSHYADLHPPPDPSAWAEIRDPAQRLRRGLTDVYRWWEETEDMMTLVLRDAPVVEAISAPVEAGRAYIGAVRDVGCDRTRARLQHLAVPRPLAGTHGPGGSRTDGGNGHPGREWQKIHLLGG
jgi:AcrR family transcriptional regulator